MPQSKISSHIPYQLLLILMFIQTLSHFSYLPLWLIAMSAVNILLVFSSVYWFSRTVPGYLRILVSLLSIILFILYFRSRFSVDMAASFLLLAALLKLLEIKEIKDAQVFIFTCLYLSTVSFLFEQGILNLLLQIISISICLYALFFIQCATDLTSQIKPFVLRAQKKTILKLFAFALPITIVFFMFFPRIAPIWHMPLKQQTTKVGISSELSPGDISSLAKSSEPAFRVSFSSEVPEREGLYWKGLILDFFDGRKWSETKTYKDVKSELMPLHSQNMDYYEVILEPHQKLWAFALENSINLSTNLIEKNQGIFRFRSEVIQPSKYKLGRSLEKRPTKFASIPTANLLTFTEVDKLSLQNGLQLPRNNANPKTRLFVKQLLSETKDSAEVMKRLLLLYAQEQFYYSLEPGELSENMIDDFLFQTKRGFCGHYASSFAYMLRLAGIPSRVVIGYQGGEFNRQGNYLLVSQFDAHAWVESYLPDVGWLRLDPTAMVAPNRILGGSFAELGRDPEFSRDNVFTSVASKFEIINWIRFRIDEVSYGWQNLVVNYHQDQQKKFFESLFGEFSLTKIALLFLALISSLFAVFIIWLLFKRLSGYTLAEKKYVSWLFCLAFVGIKREPGETPRKFLVRLENTKHTYLARITAFYTRKLEEHEYRGNK